MVREWKHGRKSREDDVDSIARMFQELELVLENPLPGRVKQRMMRVRETEITMGVKNESTIQEFILEAFPAIQHLGNLLFLVHLLAYLASIMGNMVIIIITWADHRLQTPMKG
ncbi:hypothetical protein Celaphus_00008411 [Cervus elaphus hippelaphus]|uniref:G-protein coupled receptors family 1 profile domain-containing protein n=1 Tax=Cervus elaphus hippelaphus TaxID=46360 RepID=A0A212CNL7_CEREH|nr:hypothetical protein Celaphus_00008411 [Cervus elaphus hippelaphus]